jgi:prephenate dehydrogenase
VPHVVAAALAAALQETDRPFAATGFRDATRIASGDPDLWTAILQSNADAVLAGLDRFVAGLDGFRAALRSGDAAGTRSLLHAAKESRDATFAKR